MSEPIFREKSLQKVKSPDNLNEYIRVANPSVWTVMTAVIFLLAGFCVWAVFGTLTTTVKADAHCKDGVVTCYLAKGDVEKVGIGMKAELGDYTGTVAEIVVQENSYCILTTEQTVPDGFYQAEITVESLHPADFLTN